MQRTITIVISLLVLLVSPFWASTVSMEDPGALVVRDGHDVDNPSFDTLKTNLSDYIWPTDASTKVTSSFAEYRSTHFHGGIDISTNGRKGYKVFAVRDGFVSRIRVSPNGYGKMLYIKHYDGYVSTYAHLDRFNDAIGRVVRAEQQKKESFTVDLTFDLPKLKVHQGDVIAYTGDTGFGPPHLHFELRDENLNPVNPMLCPNYNVDDRIPPVIHRLMVSPLSSTSTVENNTSPRIVRKFAGSQRSLRIPEPVRVHGLIGFALEAQDRSDGTWSRAGIHEMQFYLDDSLTFQMELNRVPSEETKQILLHYDYPSILAGRGRFQKLYVETGNTLPFYQRRKERSGIINTDLLREGLHDFRIVCRDIRGNESEVRGALFANHRPEVSIKEVDDEEIVLVGTDMSDIIKCYVYGKRNFATGWVQHTLTRERFERDMNGIELPVDTRKYDVLKIVVETRAGSRSAPLFHFNRKPNGPLHKIFIDKEMVGNDVRIILSSAGVFTTPPSVIVNEGHRTLPVFLEALDLTKYVAIVRPSDAFVGERQIEVKAEINGKPMEATDTFELFSIPAGRQGFFSTGKDGMLVFYDSGAVYEPLQMRINTENQRGTTIYSLEPRDQILNRGITVGVPLNPDQSSEKVGLYFRSTGNWILQTATQDKDRAMYSTTISRTLGDFALMRDDDPPTIGRLRVSARGGKPSVSFSYSDNLSGVDLERLKMYIDDKVVIPEIDGEHRRVSYSSADRLGSGRHSLKIILIDRLDNSNEVTRSFSVR